MLKEERQVLLIINDPEVCKNVENSIREEFKFEVETTEGKKDALKRIEASPWQYDVVVIYDDLKKKSWGIEILEEIKRIYSEIEVIIIFNSEKKDAYNALWEGAINCFYIPIRYKEIAHAVKFAREHTQSRRERKMLEKLQELSVAINSATELPEIQNLACQAAVEILGVNHSGLVLFEKGLSKGKLIAEYPVKTDFIGTEIQIKGIPFFERLVYNREIINVPELINCSDLDEVQVTLMKRKIRSLLIVPVILNNKVIASFSLHMIRKNRVFYSDEIELCRKLANQVAIAMGKARYLKELHVLNKLSLEIGASVPVDPKVADSEIEEKINEMLLIVRKHAGTLLDVKNFYIALYEEKIDEYWFVYLDDEKDDVSRIPQEKRRKGMTAYVQRTKKAIRANKDGIKELENEGAIEVVGALPRIWLGAPLIARGKVIGVMAVQNYENENAYDEHDLSLMETIASQAAIAIDNAQLFKDERQRIRDLEIVNNIVQIISTKLNTDDLFQTMTSQIAEKLNCTHCTIFLPQKLKRDFKLVPQTTHGLNSEKIMTRTFTPGEGLAGWVFQHGESIVTTDARKDYRYVPPRSKGDLPRSMLVAPVIVGNRTIGVISAQQEEINWFSESDRQLVDTLARHAGIAMERALGLNLLQEIGLQLISSEEEEIILQRVVTGAIELTNTISGTLYLISDDGKQVLKSYRYPYDLNHPPPRMHKKDGYTRLVIDTGEMFIVPDLSIDNRVNPELLKHMQAMIAVPLKIGKKVVGVLFIHDKKPRFFTETERSLLEILASQAAIGIYNSRLYKESQRQFTEIETLYEASQAITAETMNIKSVFKTILEKAVKLSNADSAQIILPQEVKGENQCKIVFSHGLDILKGVTFKQGEGLTSKVFESGQSIYTGDYHSLPDRAKIFDEPKYSNLYNSEAIVPLKWKGEVIGAIAWTSVRYNHFTNDDIRLLECFAGPAAIAIAVAREISFRQTLLNNTPDAIVAIDRRGIIKEFNKATEKILGYTTDEILNQNVTKIWGGLEKSREIKHLMSKSENGTIKDVETVVVNKYGEKIPVLFSGSLLYAEEYGEDKEEIGSIGHLEDQRIVSVRGRTRRLFEAIEEINRTEELPKLYKIILHHAIKLLEADSGYIMIEEDDYFEIVEVYNFKQNLGDKINIDINKGLIGPILKGGTPRTISLSQSTPLEIPISTNGKSFLIIPLKVKNTIIGAIYLESPINDYFRVEDELIEILSTQSAVAINRAQLLEEKDKTLERLFASAKAVAAGIMAGGFVHEVKNSLNNIGMAVGNIRRRIQKNPDIEAKKLLDKIRTIENEILQSYNLSMRLHKFGQHVPHRKLEESVNEIVKNTLELLEIKLKKQMIRVELKLDPILDKHRTPSNRETNRNLLFIDKDQIKQVIINLLLNAIDASKPRSRLIIETKSKENNVEINITDFGKGIEAKNLSKIFEPFFTTKPEGVGLGLYISKLIVEGNHQGKIDINSKPGKGTTFSVLLPKKNEGVCT